MTPTHTLVGINRQGFFKIDPRLSGNKQVESQRFVLPSTIWTMWVLVKLPFSSASSIRDPQTLDSVAQLRPIAVISLFMTLSSVCLNSYRVCIYRSGQLVLGSLKGEIRLYSSKAMGEHEDDALKRLNPHAKTTLPGFGGVYISSGFPAQLY